MGYGCRGCGEDDAKCRRDGCAECCYCYRPLTAGSPEEPLERWWHIKVAGHPTQYELECRAYQKTWFGRGLIEWPTWMQLVEGKARTDWTNEFLGEPVPPEDIKKTIIPVSRSMGKSEDIKVHIP